VNKGAVTPLTDPSIPLQFAPWLCWNLEHVGWLNDWSLGPASNAGDTRSRKLYQKLVQETCMKNLTQVHRSFLHINWPANHVARFLLRARQFLCWNRAVLSCVQETCTRKTCTRLTNTRASIL